MMSELELQFLHFKNLKLCKILGKVQIQIEATILLRRMGITKNWRWTGDFRNNTDTDTQGYDEIFQCTFTLELDNSFLLEHKISVGAKYRQWSKLLVG